MNFVEKQGNLFTSSPEYYFVHCISGDYALGAGIAKQFNKFYGMKDKLRKYYPIQNRNYNGYVGKALLIDRTFNLVTKARCYQKPTYETLTESLFDLREQCEKRQIKKLAMPRIASGLDKLCWSAVSAILQSVFLNTDIDIVIFF